jgi:hypothetical protein
MAPIGPEFDQGLCETCVRPDQSRMIYSIVTGGMLITISNHGSDMLQLLRHRKVRSANVFLPSCGLSKLFGPSTPPHASKSMGGRLQRPETRAQVAVAIGTHRKLGHNAAGDSVLAFPSII